MKKAMIIVDEEVQRVALRVYKVADIHDEWQSRVHRDDVRRYEEICYAAFPQAGRSFEYNVPIECESKVGLTWAQTH